jgi:hypothetical protein
MCEPDSSIVQLRVRRRPDRHRIEKYFVVLGEIGGRIAVDERHPSGPARLEQRHIREKSPDRLHISYLFGRTANHLTWLKHPAAARLSARGKSAADRQQNYSTIEKMHEPSVRHVHVP